MGGSISTHVQRTFFPPSLELSQKEPKSFAELQFLFLFQRRGREIVSSYSYTNSPDSWQEARQFLKYKKVSPWFSYNRVSHERSIHYGFIMLLFCYIASTRVLCIIKERTGKSKMTDNNIIEQTDNNIIEQTDALLLLAPSENSTLV